MAHAAAACAEPMLPTRTNRPRDAAADVPIDTTFTDAAPPMDAPNDVAVDAVNGGDTGDIDQGLFDSAPADSAPMDTGPPDLGPPDNGPPVVMCGTPGSGSCMDGNLTNGDGCSSACVVEAGYTCAVQQPPAAMGNWLLAITGEGTSATMHPGWTHGASLPTYFTNEATCIIQPNGQGYLVSAAQNSGWVSVHSSGCRGVGGPIGNHTFRVTFPLTAGEVLNPVRLRMSADNSIQSANLNGTNLNASTTNWNMATTVTLMPSQMVVGDNQLTIVLFEASSVENGNNTGVAVAVDTTAWYHCRR